MAMAILTYGLYLIDSELFFSRRTPRLARLVSGIALAIVGRWPASATTFRVRALVVIALPALDSASAVPTSRLVLAFRCLAVIGLSSGCFILRVFEFQLKSPRKFDLVEPLERLMNVVVSIAFLRVPSARARNGMR